MERQHDFIDIAERFEKVFNLPILFDTAGWNIQDVKAQKRMEKYVEYYSKPENFKKLEGFNLSVNPFTCNVCKIFRIEAKQKTGISRKIVRFIYNKDGKCFIYIDTVARKS